MVKSCGGVQEDAMRIVLATLCRCGGILLRPGGSDSRRLRWPAERRGIWLRIQSSAGKNAGVESA